MSDPGEDAGVASGRAEGGHPSFDLIVEPWIQCRMRDGTVTELSLKDAFHRADDVKEIVGELPTQTFAILRLMLAVLYRAIDDEDYSPASWQRLWQDGLPLDDLDDYLDEYHDRFDLLHAETPFFQVADLHTSRHEFKDVAQLIFDLPSNNRLFTTRAGKGIARLSFAEAARWLVTAQAFDSSGIKSGAVGDSRVKGGRGYPIGVAWSGLIGGVFIEGTTLAQTLLLNLVAPMSQYTAEWHDDLPPWEKAPHGPAEEKEGRAPNGPVELYTWQSRRIRLYFDDDGVFGSLISNGDKLTPQNLHRYEQMTAWRRSDPQAKKLGIGTVYMPKEHLPGRAFWRGISALLPKLELVMNGKDAAQALPPGIVQWLSVLQVDGRLPSAQRVGLRAIGVVYGSNNSVVDEVIDDRLIVSLALLRQDSTTLATVAEDAVAAADHGVWALRRLAENLTIAAGGEGSGQKSRADDSAYAALDAPYRRWLASLGPDTDGTTALGEWKSIAKGILTGLGQELIAASGPAAWRGREHRGELITTSRAENWFTLALWNTFGHTTEKDSAA